MPGDAVQRCWRKAADRPDPDVLVSLASGSRSMSRNNGSRPDQGLRRRAGRQAVSAQGCPLSCGRCAMTRAALRLSRSTRVPDLGDCAPNLDLSPESGPATAGIGSESSNTGLRALSGLSSTADGAWASSRHWMTLHGCSLSCVPYCAMQGTDSSPGPSAWTARRSCGRERSRRACPSMLGRLPRGALVVSRLGGRSHGARRPSRSSSSTSVTRPSHSHRTRLRASAGAPRA